jgi:hypothetical protein
MRILWVFFVSYICNAAVDPLSIAARYYSDHYDYKQSYALWLELYRRSPENIDYFLHVLERKLLLEGRTSVKDALVEWVEKRSQSLRKEEWLVVREKAANLRAAFLSDDGQSLYLQSLPKIERGDCNSALSLLNQALAFEKDHALILWERAKCEKKSGDFERYYQTLKTIWELDPLFSDPYDDLAEAHLYFRDNHSVLTLFTNMWSEGARTVRQRTALAVALADSGNLVSARPLLIGLLDLSKRSAANPIVLFWLGKLRLEDHQFSAEAQVYLEAFQASLKQPESKNPATPWDPYRLTERAQEAQKLLSAFGPKR